MDQRKRKTDSYNWEYICHMKFDDLDFSMSRKNRRYFRISRQVKHDP